jgi:hypothetical protein
MEDVQAPPHGGDMRSEVMRTPDDVSVMLRLYDLGWGAKQFFITRPMLAQVVEPRSRSTFPPRWA